MVTESIGKYARNRQALRSERLSKKKMSVSKEIRGTMKRKNINRLSGLFTVKKMVTISGKTS